MWMPRFMGSQRVGHDWATELNWTECWMSQQIYIFPIRWTDAVNISSKGSRRENSLSLNDPSKGKILAFFPVTLVFSG